MSIDMAKIFLVDLNRLPLTRGLDASKILTMDKHKDEEAVRVIDHLGGTTAVANHCDIKPPSVSDWKLSGIPKPWRRYLVCAFPEAFAKNSDQESA